MRALRVFLQGFLFTEEVNFKGGWVVQILENQREYIEGNETYFALAYGHVSRNGILCRWSWCASV